jgi:hypothetical protein
MCYSSDASFTLAAILAVSGGYCVSKAVRADRSLLAVSMIPVVFAVQQFCEGWVWTGLDRGDPGLTSVAARAYLVFALMFWPVWIPYSTLLVERTRRTRFVLRVMTVTGAALGLALIAPILLDASWLTIQVTRHSLHYNLGQSPLVHVVPGTLWQALYLILVATPLFVSSIQPLVQFGLALVLSAAITHVFFDEAFASVWCFLSAALSGYLAIVFWRIPARLATPVAVG